MILQINLKRTIMKKITILLMCFSVNVCLFAQPSNKKELGESIKNEIEYWVDNCSYNELSEDEVAFVVDEICGRYMDNKHILSNNVLKEASRIQKTYNLFRKGDEAIRSPYDKVTVDLLVSEFADAMKKEKNENRQAELSDIYKKLYDYEYASEVWEDFQAAIAEAMTNNPKNKGQAIQDVINQQTKDGFVEEIQNNPFLSGLYDEYIKSLVADNPIPSAQSRGGRTPRRR